MKRLVGIATLGLMALGFVGSASAYGIYAPRVIAPRVFAPRVVVAPRVYAPGYAYAGPWASRVALLNSQIYDLRPLYIGYTPAQIAWRAAERARFERELFWLRHHRY